MKYGDYRDRLPDGETLSIICGVLLHESKRFLTEVVPTTASAIADAIPAESEWSANKSNKIFGPVVARTKKGKLKLNRKGDLSSGFEYEEEEVEGMKCFINSMISVL